MFLGLSEGKERHVRRAIPLLAVLLAFTGVATLRPGEETGACAQGDAVVPRADCEARARAQTLESCAATTQSFRSVAVRRSGRGLRFSFTRRVNRPVRVDVFQVSSGRTVLGQRLVARFSRRTQAFRWDGRRARRGRRLTDGLFFARFTIRDERGRLDERRIALVRRNGRFALRRDFYRRTSCATLTSYKLERPAFGGRRNRALGISFRLARAGRVRVEVRRAAASCAASRRPRAGRTSRTGCACARRACGAARTRSG
jgi:hypothetical protein